MQPLLQYKPPSDAIEILAEEERYIIANKPAGLLSVPGKEERLSDCLEARLREQYKDTLLVHRLDMDTSGVMVFARKKRMQRELSAQFERKETSKRYIALVEGIVQEDEGEVDLPLLTDWPNRPLQKVDAEGKPSRTLWHVLERIEQTTLVALTPITGRTHQLRVHMKEIGHPILGDRFYGNAATAARLCLHAEILAFSDPDTGESLSFTAPAPF